MYISKNKMKYTGKEYNITKINLGNSLFNYLIFDIAQNCKKLPIKFSFQT